MSAVRHPRIYIGCAGWSIPKQFAADFSAAGSHLQRYAKRLPAVEINSSFYRSHRPTTYARWADSVPTDFRFAVKMPRGITHRRRLTDAVELLEGFLGEVAFLGDKLGPLLVQLPPRLPFGGVVAAAFFGALRQRFAGEVVCEPRHVTWFSPAAAELLTQYRVARAAADPAIIAAAAEPGAWTGLAYFRLHGSPEVYYSPYSSGYLETLVGRLVRQALSASVWCIFDNTALGHATMNALDVLQRLADVTE